MRDDEETTSVGYDALHADNRGINFKNKNNDLNMGGWGCEKRVWQIQCPLPLHIRFLSVPLHEDLVARRAALGLLHVLCPGRAVRTARGTRTYKR